MLADKFGMDLDEAPLRLSPRGGTISINISKNMSTDLKLSPTQTPLSSPVNSPSTPNNNSASPISTDVDTANSSPVTSKDCVTPFSSPNADNKTNNIQKKVRRQYQAVRSC